VPRESPDASISTLPLLVSSPYVREGRGLVPCAAHLALCFCCPLLSFLAHGGESWLPSRPWGLRFCWWRCRSVLRFAGRGACLQFRLSVALNGTSCAAKQGETNQQPTRPRASDGNQAAPLASPSPPPVQCPFPGLTYWLFSSLGHFLARNSGRNAH